MASDESTTVSAWDPLRHPLFRAMWIAAIVSNVGTWMQNVGAAWLMTSLTTSPTLVALVQTATTLPIFLFALPAGAIGDIVDRRILLLAVQAWMVVSAALLGLLTIAGMTTPLVLLLFTFGLGLGSGMAAPAWQAIQPELVPREELAAAVSLGSVGINVARAVGPAIGGVVITVLGPGAVFLLNAVSFLATIVVVYRWRREPSNSTLPPERLAESIRGGVRYVRNELVLRAVMARTVGFIFFASALWALLPLVVRFRLGLGSSGYGVSLGLLGLGAIAGAGLVPTLRNVASRDSLVLGATAVFASTIAALSLSRNVPLVGLSLLAGGAAWLTVLSNLNTVVQSQSPRWVRARTLAVYFLFFQGGLAIGSVVWGFVAEYAGVVGALQIASVGLLASLVSRVRWRLPSVDDRDLTPSHRWSDPVLAIEPSPEQGPVLVTVEYQVDPRDVSAFLDAIQDLGRVRRRNGAYRWGIFRDAAADRRYLETYVVESWVGHMREHERFSIADQAVQDRVREYHSGDEPPAVSHFLWAVERSPVDGGELSRTGE